MTQKASATPSSRRKSQAKPKRAPPEETPDMGVIGAFSFEDMATVEEVEPVQNTPVKKTMRIGGGLPKNIPDALADLVEEEEPEKKSTKRSDKPRTDELDESGVVTINFDQNGKESPVVGTKTRTGRPTGKPEPVVIPDDGIKRFTVVASSVILRDGLKFVRGEVVALTPELSENAGIMRAIERGSLVPV